MAEVLLTPGNPASPHGPGRHARELLERSRRTIAERMGVAHDRVVFTSGGTEANGLALLGFPGPKLVGATEHASVLEVVPDARRIPVDGRGVMDLEALARLLAEERPGSRLGDAGQQRDRRGAADRRGRPARACGRRAAPLRRRAGIRQAPLLVGRAGCRSGQPVGAQARRAARRRGARAPAGPGARRRPSGAAGRRAGAARARPICRASWGSRRPWS